MARAHSPKGGGRKAWFWVLGAVIVALAVALVVVLVDARRRLRQPAATTTTTDGAGHHHDHGADHHAPPRRRRRPTTHGRAAGHHRRPADLRASTCSPRGRTTTSTDAANVASADAVTQMFAQAYPAKGPYTFSNCDPAAGSLYCTWNGQNGATIQMTVRTLTGGLPVQVQSVTFSP